MLGVRIVREYLVGRSQLVRQRIRMVTLGTLVGLLGSRCDLPGLGAQRSRVAVNTAGFTGFLFALAVAYAVVKHDLFEIDAMVKRGAYYILLTGAIGAAYAMSIVLFNWALPGAITDSGAFPLLFTLAVIVLFNPLRTFLQGVVDRVFFRTSYDSAQGARGGRWRSWPRRSPAITSRVWCSTASRAQFPMRARGSSWAA